MRGALWIMFSNSEFLKKQSPNLYEVVYIQYKLTS